MAEKAGWETEAIKEIELPAKASPQVLIKLLVPEGLGAKETLTKVQLMPWKLVPETFVAMLASEESVALPPRPGEYLGRDVYRNRVWLALVSIPAASGAITELARPYNGHLELQSYESQSFTVAPEAVELARGKHAMEIVASHHTMCPGGFGEATAAHLILIHRKMLVPVFGELASFEAECGGDWQEDGTRDRESRRISVARHLAKSKTHGYFDLILETEEAIDGDRRTHARKRYVWGDEGKYVWDGEENPRNGKPMFYEPVDGTFEFSVSDFARGKVQRMEQLLAKDDLDGVMDCDLGYALDGVAAKTDSSDGLVLPPASREKIMRAAHRKALELYKQDPARALGLLGYGISQWLNHDSNSDLDANVGHPPFIKYLQADSDPETAPMLNDYAYILAQSAGGASDRGLRLKSAAVLLETTIRLAPARDVAYLNLGDVTWELGKRDKARPLYRKYLKLIGSGSKEPPQRVLMRTR
jgi:hypothetical protein